jgi:hypothetical protein
MALTSARGSPPSSRIVGGHEGGWEFAIQKWRRARVFLRHCLTDASDGRFVRPPRPAYATVAAQGIFPSEDAPG